MALSLTYSGLANQIAFELGQRTDLLSVPAGSNLTLSPIQIAIQTALAKWEREHFYFNEIGSPSAPATFNTVNGQEFYTASAFPLLATQPHIDKIWILISSNRYTLNPRTEQYLSDTSVNPVVTGQPVDYALYAETLRLYPIPNGAYPITVEGTQRFSALVNPGDTNAFLQDGADLIRAEAKMYLYREVLKNKALADDCHDSIYGNPMRPNEVGYLEALRSENVQRTAVGKMRAMYF